MVPKVACGVLKKALKVISIFFWQDLEKTPETKKNLQGQYSGDEEKRRRRKQVRSLKLKMFYRFERRSRSREKSNLNFLSVYFYIAFDISKSNFISS